MAPHTVSRRPSSSPDGDLQSISEPQEPVSHGTHAPVKRKRVKEVAQPSTSASNAEQHTSDDRQVQRRRLSQSNAQDGSTLATEQSTPHSVPEASRAFLVPHKFVWIVLHGKKELARREDPRMRFYKSEITRAQNFQRQEVPTHCVHKMYMETRSGEALSTGLMAYAGDLTFEKAMGKASLFYDEGCRDIRIELTMQVQKKPVATSNPAAELQIRGGYNTSITVSKDLGEDLYLSDCVNDLCDEWLYEVESCPTPTLHCYWRNGNDTSRHYPLTDDIMHFWAQQICDDKATAFKPNINVWKRLTEERALELGQLQQEQEHREGKQNLQQEQKLRNPITGPGTQNIYINCDGVPGRTSTILPDNSQSARTVDGDPTPQQACAKCSKQPQLSDMQDELKALRKEFANLSKYVEKLAYTSSKCLTIIAEKLEDRSDTEDDSSD